MPQKHIYFASDFHLGRNGLHSSEVREEKILELFNQFKEDAAKVYLVGDLFDYWFEYKHAIPRGFSRFIAGLVDLKNAGVDVELFTGNHDMWMLNYFQNLGFIVHKDPIIVEHFGKRILVGHGDGLGPGDYNYKFLRRVFRNKICQWLFARIHPNTGIGLMKYFSNQSRKKGQGKEDFETFEKEWLVQYCENYTAHSNIDYFLFGHRHIPMEYQLNSSNARYINLGDSLHHYTYGVLKQSCFSLISYGDKQAHIETNI